jgi:transcriptional regulator with XRE-family HTH domain
VWYNGIVQLRVKLTREQAREVLFMKIKLTLQEKLKDLRVERNMTLSDLAGATGIPLSTLQRTEGQDDVRVGYQDIAALAKFYGVSADYLFGLTDNRQHRHIEIDALRLSDGAIEILKSETLNNRLVSELIAHPDFPRLMSAAEVYIDRKVLPQMNTMNAMYKAAESAIKEKFEVADNDEIISLLQEAIVDEDEYLRYRISERFNALMKSLFDAHKKDALPDEQTAVLQEMKTALSDYPAQQEQEEKARWKMTLFAKQIGLNITELTDGEIAVLMKTLRKSEKYRQGKRRR